MDGKQVARSLAAFVIKIAVAVLVVLLVYRLAVSAYTFGFRIFAEKPMTEGAGVTVTVAVTEDDSVKDLGQKLYDMGLIRDTGLFYFQELFSDYHGMVLPGVYQLNTSMTVEEMLEKMSTEQEQEEELLSVTPQPITDDMTEPYPEGMDDGLEGDDGTGQDMIDNVVLPEGE